MLWNMARYQLLSLLKCGILENQDSYFSQEQKGRPKGKRSYL